MFTTHQPSAAVVLVDMSPCIELLAGILDEPSDLEFVLGWAIDDAPRYIDRLDDLELGMESFADCTRDLLDDADSECNPGWIETVVRARVATARYISSVFRDSNLYDHNGSLMPLEHTNLRGPGRCEAVFATPE